MRDPKFKKLVHYICNRCTDSPVQLGATKLNKILWISDLFAYIDMGQPITEERYIKKQYGPVAETMRSTLENLQQEQSLLIRNGTFPTPTLYFSMKEPDISDFTSNQISLVDRVIGWVVNEHSAVSISEFTHKHYAWNIASIGEHIPHHAVFASSSAEIDEHDISWAKRTIKD